MLRSPAPLHAVLNALALFLAGSLALPAAEVVFPGAEWERATPESQGLKKENVEAAAAHIARISGKDGADRTVIVKNGYVVWEGSRAGEAGPVWSVTKSFLSTCFGLLWDDGRVEPDMLASDIESSLSDLYPEMTLRHLATFTSGYDYEDKQPLVPAKPLFHPGDAFRYSRESDLLAGLLTKIGGKQLDALFAERIGGPIGIAADQMQWGRIGTPSGGEICGGSGVPPGVVSITPLAIARLGWLMCNGGKWDGQELVSANYLDYATTPKVPATTPPFDPKGWYTELPGNYGFNWWTNGPLPDGGVRWPSAPGGVFLAQGNKNNNLIVVPAWNLVVVRLGTDKIVGMQHYDRVFELLDPARQ